MAGINPYALFGLNEHNANLVTARQAYRCLALDTHPDRLQGNAEQFKVVHAAWKWVEGTLQNVPDTNEVVAKFESRRVEWEKSALACTLPSLREIVTGEKTCEPEPERPIWPAFPPEGYGQLMATGNADPVVPFPPCELVLYKEPRPVGDKLLLHVCPAEGIGQISDMSIDGASDYKLAYSEQPGQLPDIRTERASLDDLKKERSTIHKQFTNESSSS